MATEKLTKEEKAEQKRLAQMEKDIKTADKLVHKLLSKYVDTFDTLYDEEQVKSYIDEAIFNGEIAIDTETTGLNVYRDKCVGVCIYTPNKREAYIPLNHVDYRTRKKIDGQLSEQFVAEQLSRLEATSTKVIMHNANFDIRVLRRLGARLTCYWDTLLAAQLMDENDSHGLKHLFAKYILKQDEKDDEFSFGDLFSFKNMTFADIPIEIGAIYAAHDPKMTYDLYKFQQQFLKPDGRNGLDEVYKVLMDIEMPCLDAVCNMEDTGFAFDFEYNQVLKDKYHKLLDEENGKLTAMLYDNEDKIKEWRQTDAANKKEMKPDILFKLFSSFKDKLITAADDSKKFKVEKTGDEYTFASANGSFSIDLDAIFEGYQYNEKGKVKKVSATDMKKIDKIKTSGEYAIPYAKSAAEQLPENIEEINLGSPTQLAVVLYDALGLPAVDDEKPRGTGEEVLKEFAKTHEFAKQLLNFRHYSKLVTAFIDTLPESVTDDGKLHFSLNQYGAKTGRMSSSSPNIQQIPAANDEIRRMFVAPRYERDVEVENNILVLKNTEEVEVSTNNWVFAKDLKVGDTIENNKIIDIRPVGNIIRFTFE